ncbi:hypothetical protein [Phaeobacter italicus]|uniref:hypothetical protein n=4 Tax=Phaeobacter italicus TaxID=481446 RepID=UPI00067FD640|nr:hypothetical protein [Phaeobacter italicus]MBY6042732.1 hypothetical protein [Phaeobacter italicus]
MTEAADTVNSIVLCQQLVQAPPMSMRNHMFAGLSLAMLLAGCGPVPVYWKDGAEVSRRDADLLACEVEALKDAPVANQIRQRPPVFYPGREICRQGRCYRTAGYWEDGEIYTVDVNADLRKRVELSCMAAKGYQSVALKRCPQKLADQLATYQSRTLPPIGPASCAIPQRGQQPKIAIAPE